MTAQSATAMQLTKVSVPVRKSSGDLLEQFDSVYDSIAQRAFDLFEGNGRWLGHDLDDWFRAEAEVLHPVHLETRESDGSFTVEAEVPGFTAKDLEINVEPRCLKIAGKRETKEEEKKGKAIRSEWCADQILRAVDLPADVDTAKASASLKDGILTIDLPKAAHAKSVRIEPKTA
ncbi:MAG: Hsp20 family protein [Candidatus Acidiferrales bacterium]